MQCLAENLNAERQRCDQRVVAFVHLCTLSVAPRRLIRAGTVALMVARCVGWDLGGCLPSQSFTGSDMLCEWDRFLAETHPSDSLPTRATERRG